MRKKLIFLLPLTLSSALAQAGVKIQSLDIDSKNQSAKIDVIYDFGFPLGVKQGTYDFQCPSGNLSVKSFKVPDLSDMMFNTDTEVDPEATDAFSKARLINSKPPYAILRLDNGIYKLVCKSGVLISDFSDFGKKNYSLIVDGNNVSFSSNFMYLGRVTLNIPVLGKMMTLIIPTDSKNLSTIKSVAIGSAGMLTPSLVAQEEGSALFSYISNKNTLIPLQFDGKVGKSENVNNVTVPQDRSMIFYYTDNYKQDNDWYKIVIDLANYQSWVEKSSKPKSAKIIP